MAMVLMVQSVLPHIPISPGNLVLMSRALMLEVFEVQLGAAVTLYLLARQDRLALRLRNAGFSFIRRVPRPG